jgi:hypothetical protein
MRRFDVAPSVVAIPHAAPRRCHFAGGERARLGKEVTHGWQPRIAAAPVR